MSRHIDLIAVGALLLALALATRVHDAMHGRMTQGRLFHLQAIKPVVIAPPRVPAPPRLPHWLVKY